MSLACWYPTACFRCADQHNFKGCKEAAKYAACGEGHVAGSETCPKRKVEKAKSENRESERVGSAILVNSDASENK